MCSFAVNRFSNSAALEWNHSRYHRLSPIASSVGFSPGTFGLGQLFFWLFYAHSVSDIRDVCSCLKFIISYQYLRNHQIWVWDSSFLSVAHPHQSAHTLLCSPELSLVPRQLWITSGVSVSQIAMRFLNTSTCRMLHIMYQAVLAYSFWWFMSQPNGFT